MGKEYVIGMDGGGTATQVIVAAMDQTVLAKFQVGPLNINGQSKETTKESLKTALQKIKELGRCLEDCSGICVGAAGVSNLETQEVITQFLVAEGIHAPIHIVGDHETALAGALETPHGIILIAGTGSICFGRASGKQTYRVGGYGHIIDDAGSAYAIGRDILKEVVRAKDGREEPTCLTYFVFEQLRVHSAEELITWLYAKERSKGEIAGLAVLLEKALEQEDEAANRILQTTVLELVKLAKAALRHFETPVQLVVSGSVLMKNQRIYEDFCQKLLKEYPKTSIFKMRGSAAEGAVNIILEEIRHGEKWN